MVRILGALLTIAAAGVLDVAMARDYPFCIKGCDFGAGYCGFDSYAQCQAAAAGRDAWCAANPIFQQGRASQPVSYHQRKFHAPSLLLREGPLGP
jgi:hypothetical protein